MHLALVLNRNSGSIEDPDALIAELRSRCDALSVHEVGDHAAAAATSPDRLIVAGGDGSIADVFAAARGAGVQLGVLPGGTANDFVRALGLPLEMDEAIDLVTLPAAHTAQTWGGELLTVSSAARSQGSAPADDLGDGEAPAPRPFVNVASIGLAVDAAEYAEDHKRRFGPLAYGVGAAQAGVLAHPTRAGLVVNDASVADGRVWQLLIGASGRFGGGAGLGEAEAGERSLVAAWVPAGTRLTLPFRALGLRNRTIERQPGVRWWRGHHLVVHASQHGRPARWNVDGERWDPGAQRVEVRPLGPVDVVTGIA